MPRIRCRNGSGKTDPSTAQVLHPAIRHAIALFCLLFLAPAKGVETHQVFGDWTVKCHLSSQQARTTRGGTPDEAVGCFAFQRVETIGHHPTLNGSGKISASAAIVYPPKKALPLLVLTLPLGIWLPDGILIQVRGERHGKSYVRKARNLPVKRCIDRGCVATFLLNEADLTHYKNGGRFDLIFYERRKQGIAISFSLIGFSAALSALDRHRPPPD